MSIFEQCLMGLEDDILGKRISVPDPDIVLVLAKYIYAKPALSVHADGLLEHLLDQFSVDVVATNRWPAPGVYNVEYCDELEAIVLYDIADVLIIRRCHNFDAIIHYFLGNHVIYIGSDVDEEIIFMCQTFDIVSVNRYNKTQRVWIFKKSINDITDYETM